MEYQLDTKRDQFILGMVRNLKRIKFRLFSEFFT